MPILTCAWAIGNLWSIHLGTNILSPVPLSGVNNGMLESFEKQLCDALLDVLKSLSNFNEVYLSSMLDCFNYPDCSDCYDCLDCLSLENIGL